MTNEDRANKCLNDITDEMCDHEWILDADILGDSGIKYEILICKICGEMDFGFHLGAWIGAPPVGFKPTGPQFPSTEWHDLEGGIY